VASGVVRTPTPLLSKSREIIHAINAGGEDGVGAFLVVALKKFAQVAFGRRTAVCCADGGLLYILVLPVGHPYNSAVARTPPTRSPPTNVLDILRVPPGPRGGHGTAERVGFLA